jgi:hypothetical protein
LVGLAQFVGGVFKGADKPVEVLIGAEDPGERVDCRAV